MGVSITEKSLVPIREASSIRVSSFLRTPKMSTTPAAAGRPSQPTVTGLIVPWTTCSSPTMSARTMTMFPATMRGRASLTKCSILSQDLLNVTWAVGHL